MAKVNRNERLCRRYGETDNLNRAVTASAAYRYGTSGKLGCIHLNYMFYLDLRIPLLPTKLVAIKATPTQTAIATNGSWCQN